MLNHIWLGNQWGWCFRKTVHPNFSAGKHTARMNTNCFLDSGMIYVSVEDVTDTYSRNCVISLQLFACFFFLSPVTWNKKKVKLICNYFTFKYIKAYLLKVVFSASLSLSKASAKFGIVSTCDPEAPHHRPCAWKHRCAISCVKLLLRTGSVHFAKVGINVPEGAGTAFC